MRKLSLLLFAVSAAVPALPLSSSNAPADGAPRVEAEWTKAMKGNDVEAVVACYAADAVLWSPGETQANGIEAIRASYAAMLKDNTVKDVGISDEHHRLSGNVGAGWGRFVLTLAPKSGGPDVVVRGRFTEVVEKREGKWLYVADHASEDPPAAPAH